MANTFQVDLQSGLLESAIYRESPHHDARPPETIIDMIVIHGISLPPGEFGSNTIEAFFCGKLDMTSHAAFPPIAHLRVSSHLLIKRTGEIMQFVPFTNRAWHAGESFFAGRTCCNDFSIGIELEGTDDIPYEKIQYTQLGRVVEGLMQAYPAISRERLVGHVDIAPGRKTDPGPLFDWAYLKGR
jgi:AmpD protein